jgi:hypothetical protein
MFWLGGCSLKCTTSNAASSYFVNGSWDIVILGMIIYWWVETQGKTLEEIDALFEGEKHSSVPDVEMVRKGREQIDTKAVE